MELVVEFRQSFSHRPPMRDISHHFQTGGNSMSNLHNAHVLHFSYNQLFPSGFMKYSGKKLYTENKYENKPKGTEFDFEQEPICYQRRQALAIKISSFVVINPNFKILIFFKIRWTNRWKKKIVKYVFFLLVNHLHSCFFEHQMSDSGDKNTFIGGYKAEFQKVGYFSKSDGKITWKKKYEALCFSRCWPLA